MLDSTSTANDLGRGPMIMALTWSFVALAFISVALRFLARLKAAKRLALVDWLMLLALTFDVVFTWIQTVAYHHGLGKYDVDYTPDEVLQTLKYVRMGTPFGLVASALARISIAVFFVKMLGVRRWFKSIVIAVSVAMAVLTVPTISGMFADQDPVGNEWRPAPSSRDWDNMIYVYLSYAGKSFSTLTDFVYVVPPIGIVLLLNMSLGYRLDNILLLSANLLFVVVSTLSEVSLRRIHIQHVDPLATNSLHDGSLVVLYRGLEQSLVIIVGSLPSLGAIGKLDISRTFFFDSWNDDTRQRSSSESAWDGSSEFR